ncbi:DUF3231 family protein [Priestia megaterium]|nr:DUF3231 family protein [Priestia megaterium]MDH3160357.1 DUF3231 family protein [Priestia megaterium]MED4116755.1 DUF3231 family protein [Priestia megaterium]
MRRNGKLQKKNKLTSPEMANLWAHYIRETLSICVNRYMLQAVYHIQV